LLLAAAAPASAHSFTFTEATLRLGPDGTFAAFVVCDLDALALGVDASASDSAALAAEIQALPAERRRELVDELKAMLKRRVRILFDGQPAAFEVALPEEGRPRPPGDPPSALGLVARFTGPVPPGARSVSFFASRAFPPVRLDVVSADGRTLASEVLERGGASTPMALDAPREARAAAVFWRFLRLGYEHILPAGLDHVLFVLGLALLSTRIKPLLLQVSAFTLAHTITLALAVYGVVSLPSRVVEPLIAASIVYVGVENLFRSRPSWTRVAVVFAFGLLHGMGFAGVLTELGWPQGRRLLALIAFNLGVELGQLSVIAMAVALLAAAARLGLPRRRTEQALSLAIALVAAVWTVQRLLG
jgi:hydrogenase/urease accessory protein HupE